MFNWYKIANKETIIEKVKSVLKEHPFTSRLLRYYHIPDKDVDNNLEIIFKKLKGKYAEANGEKIILDNSLLVDDEEFLTEHFHFIIHEFFHWLKRRAEKNFYFSDSEEVQGFVVGIAWEIMDGKPYEEISKIYWPIVKKHFHDPKKARQVYLQMYNKAQGIVKILQNL